MVLKSEIEKHIDLKDTTDYSGYDWWQLTAEDIAVFEIEPSRWQRMMTAYHFFEVFLGIADVGEDEAPAGLLEAEREKRPDIVALGHSITGFSRFALEYVGLTSREADAVYWKMYFWNVRHSVLEYEDENDVPGPPAG